ncbi:MAG: LysM peptidoglycan-binding domain-containing protein [Bacilli bacterium]|nr:LysM peptidoglycan-binding domain-containing protein [Bacilli bacterium]
MAKVVIDAGHGGNDPGASGNGIVEKEYTLKISQYIYDRLRELGLDVKMTRTTDETLSPTERVNRVLNAFGDSSDVLVISNHINAGGGDGAEVIYALRNKDTLSNLILTEIENEGQNIRKAYQRRLPSDTSKDYYFMQRNTGDTESITVEYGFLDSTGDDVNQLKNNWENYAEAVVRAIIEYLNLTYVPVEGGNYYTVKSGDSLWSIAKKYNVSVSDLKEANGLTSSMLTIGDVLKIPVIVEEEPKENVYVVKKGDSLYKIAQNYDTTVSEIIQLNNLTSTALSIGQLLEIPVTTITENTYTVKSGDSLYKIAQNYNTTVNELVNLNNLSSTALSIGQILKLPSTTTGMGNTYTVKSGDNLYEIARKNNTTVSDLMSINNLSSTLLSIGQVLKLPITTASSTYTIKSGDNLYKIARENNTTVSELMRINNLGTTLLSIGQVLKLK